MRPSLLLKINKILVVLACLGLVLLLVVTFFLAFAPQGG